MENIKVSALKHVNEFVADPGSKAVSIASNLLWAAVGIWFASLILNFAIKIGMDSYAIITSAF